MTYARKSLVSLQDTPYYHVISRCVRRAWLWGFDEYCGRDYSHRKEWVLERMHQLSMTFAIDVCAYAIMSNHYHLVLHVDQRHAKAWSPQDVIDRWCMLFSKPELVARWEEGACEGVEREVAEGIIERWRRRLCDVSWYMRCLNEYLARRANTEDECTGRFWEGRFKSQALLDEAGLLTSMVYVDLNPIRAGIAKTPESSEFTSIYQRIEQLKSSATSKSVRPRLMSFRDMNAEPHIPFSLSDYLELVDWAGRSIRLGKKGAIDRHMPSILQRLNLQSEAWRNAMRPGGNAFGRAIGRVSQLQLHAQMLEQSWIRGMATARRLFA